MDAVTRAIYQRGRFPVICPWLYNISQETTYIRDQLQKKKTLTYSYLFLEQHIAGRLIRVRGYVPSTFCCGSHAEALIGH